MNSQNYSILYRLIGRVYRTEGLPGLYRRLVALTNGYQIDLKKYDGVFSKAFILKVNKYTKKLNVYKRNILKKMFFIKARGQFYLHIDEGGSIFTSLFSNKCCIRGWGFRKEPFGDPIALRLKHNNEYVEFSRVNRPDLIKAFKFKIKDEKPGFEATIILKKSFNIVKIQYLDKENKWKSCYTKIFFNIENRKFLLFNKKLNYVAIKKKRRLCVQEQIISFQNHISLIDANLHFEIYIEDINDYGEFKNTLDSLDAQIYKNFSIHINEDIIKKFGNKLNNKHKVNPPPSENLNIFWMVIPAGYELEINALYEFFNAYLNNQRADIIYADEDYLIAGSYANPFYKPDWSPDYLETFNYVGDMAAYRSGKIDKNFLLKNKYDFVLRYTELTSNIVHVKKVLGSGKLLPERISPKSNKENITALNGRLKRTRRQGNAQENTEFYGSYLFDINLREMPLVSIIIPTAGKVANLAGVNKDLICNVVSEIFSKSTYINIEVIVVDGGELSPSQLKFIQKFGCRRIQHGNKKFNYSNSCNTGANIACGEILVFLNDDIEIVTPHWIEGILAHFEKPHVGAVGCQLLYPSGLLQHVGVVHNRGCPDHVMDGMDSGVSGYFYNVSGVRNYQAVTGACQAVPKKLFFDVGGYSEDLAVCFNDTDLCMKIASHSKYIVYDGGVRLIHMTSQSRSSSAPLNIEEINLYQEKWKFQTIEDPFYNEKNLSILRPTFEPKVNLDTL